MDTTMNTPNPMPELAALLKQLRLSGLMDSLAQRNREAIEGKLEGLEGLEALGDDPAQVKQQGKGAMNKMRRVLEDLGDENSKTGKALAKIKGGAAWPRILPKSTTASPNGAGYRKSPQFS